MNIVFLLLGGNTGNREHILNKTFQLINQKIGKVIKSSSIYETEPVNGPPQGKYLNGVIKIRTNLSGKIHSIF